jgi:hypothetical protein
MQFLQPIGSEVYKFLTCKRKKKVYVVKHYNELFETDLKEPIVEPMVDLTSADKHLPVVEESAEESAEETEETTKVVSMEDQAKQILQDIHDDDMTYDNAELDHWVFTRKLAIDSNLNTSTEPTLIVPNVMPQ